MKKVIIYPGTFDPITFGHIDVIKKSLKLFDKVVVALSDGNNKNYLFNSDERIKIVNKALFFDLKMDKNKIEIVSFKTLTTDLCKKYKSNIILRGLRAVSDFEYEFQLAGMNRKLNNKIETIFLMSDVENQIISSRFVKEIIRLKGDIKKFTTKSTIKSLKEKYEKNNI
jgi:pantetheine-phosphate adenylyltransferase